MYGRYSSINFLEKFNKWPVLPLRVGDGQRCGQGGIGKHDSTLTIKNAQPVATVDGQARDFGPEDATLQFSSPLISADGKEVASTKGSIAGPTVWIDLPGHGRFVFSLAPRTDLGLQGAGEIRGNVVTWRSNGHDYKVVTDTAVTTGARAYNLYMIHLPRQVNQFNISAGARLDDPLRGK